MTEFVDSGSVDSATEATDNSVLSIGAEPGRRYRIVLAKLGLDGHDRGIKVVARILRDSGFEVIYLGLRQTTDSIIAAAEQEDADAVGLSMHNAGHLTLAPAMLAALTEAEMDIPLIVGGIIPDDDRVELSRAGVAVVLGPGATAAEVVSSVTAAIVGHGSSAAETPAGTA